MKKATLILSGKRQDFWCEAGVGEWGMPACRRVSLEFVDASNDALLTADWQGTGCKAPEETSLSAAEMEDFDKTPDSYVWTYDEQQETFILTSCPAGHKLVNSSGEGFKAELQKCVSCKAGQYILDQMRGCQNCPKGADCPDGDAFLPKAVGSAWEEAEHLTATGEYVRVKRIVMCPPGHALEREAENPSNDNCVRCERTTYRLEPSYVNSTEFEAQCLPCDPKAECAGGDVAESVEGYWRFQPLPWDEMYEYLPGSGSNCQGREGQPCLFPNQGFVPMRGWEQVEMVCTTLPGGGDELYCARPIPQKLLVASRRQGSENGIDVLILTD